MSRHFHSALWLLAILIPMSISIKMTIEAGQTRCLKHESPLGVITNGLYDASEDLSHIVDLVIKDSKGHLLFNREAISKGTFAFSTEDYEIFEVCFISRAAPAGRDIAPRKVFLDVKQGAEAKDFEQLAKAEKLKPVEMELKRLEALTDEIVRDFNHMHLKSSKMRSTNESTHNRVLCFSILSMLILIGFACWQVLYLRRYFKSKKLIE